MFSPNTILGLFVSGRLWWGVARRNDADYPNQQLSHRTPLSHVADHHRRRARLIRRNGIDNRKPSHD